MKSKYTYKILTEVIIYPNGAKLAEDAPIAFKEMTGALEAGYEIYQYVHFNTSTVSGIRWILRKENDAE